jgi:hypothetical protein
VRDVFACLLTLEGDPFDSFLSAARHLVAWSFDRYELPLAEPIPPSGRETPESGVTIRWETLQHPDRPAAVWSMSWSHPDGNDETLEWGVRARVGYDSSEAWLSLRVAVQPVTTVLRPVKIVVGRPQVISGWKAYLSSLRS